MAKLNYGQSTGLAQSVIDTAILVRRGAEDHRQHRGAAADCEDPVAPGARCAGAVSERAAARGARAACAVQPAVNGRISPDFIDR